MYKVTFKHLDKERDADIDTNMIRVLKYGSRKNKKKVVL